jgi:hypothetical protein
MNPAFWTVSCSLQGWSSGVLIQSFTVITEHLLSECFKDFQTTLRTGRRGKQSDAEVCRLLYPRLHLISDLLLVITGKSRQLRHLTKWRNLMPRSVTNSNCLINHTQPHFIGRYALDYYVTAQTCLKKGRWRQSRTVKWVSLLWATPTQKPAASRELNCLTLVSAVRECGLVHSAHTRKLSSACAPSHCNRAPLLGHFSQFVYFMMPSVSRLYSVNDGMIIECGEVSGMTTGRKNWSTRRKTSSSVTFSTTNSTSSDLG